MFRPRCSVKSKGRGARAPSNGDPFDFFSGPEQRRRFSPEQQEEPRLEVSGGAGFLISDDGYILTHYHVVEDATKIKGNLTGDPHHYITDVVGNHPPTDLPLLKIKNDKKPAYPFLRASETN